MYVIQKYYPLSHIFWVQGNQFFSAWVIALKWYERLNWFLLWSIIKKKKKTITMTIKYIKHTQVGKFEVDKHPVLLQKAKDMKRDRTEISLPSDEKPEQRTLRNWTNLSHANYNFFFFKKKKRICFDCFTHQDIISLLNFKMYLDCKFTTHNFDLWALKCDISISTTRGSLQGLV